MRAKAYIFDVFGTIVDWRTSIARESLPFFSSKNIDIDPLTFADKWRGKYQPAMERIRSGNRGYVKLDTLHRENLDELLDELNIAGKFTEEDKQELNRSWEKLSPWSDSAKGLLIVKQSAIIAPCSNGSIALMTRVAKFADLPWDCIVGAEIAQTYKPEPQAYLKSVEALGLQSAEVCMVAAHNSDLLAARECGLQTAFIPRPTEYGPNQNEDLEPTDYWDQVILEIGDLK